MYSTSLLRVVLRCNPVAFGQWGLNLLTSQLNDTDQSVVLETVSILDEALEDKVINVLHQKQETTIQFDLIEIGLFVL